MLSYGVQSLHLERIAPSDEALECDAVRVYCLHDATARRLHVAALVVVAQDASAEAAHLDPPQQ